VHTRQWQPSDGTPIEVPEPRMVTFMGAEDMWQLGRAKAESESGAAS
jgi:hypothetical protein